MNELLKIILSLSLSGALLILVLFLFKPFIKDKLSKQWQYYIWFLVVVRLLLPFAPETNLMGILFQHFDTSSIHTDISPQPELDNLILSETKFADYNKADISIGKVSEPGKLSSQNIFDIAAQNIDFICFLIWLIVVIGLLIRKVTIYQSFVKYIKVGRVEVSDMALWEQVGKLVEQTGIKGSVGLYTNSLVSSPLLVGFFHPYIILPTTELSDSDFQYTILHELTHFKRHDMFYKWLVQVIICLHWFNPLVHLMGREINRTCELSCDEAIIKSLDAKGQRAYGDTLLNAMGMGGVYKNTIASISLTEGKKLLKERLDAIMKFRKKSKQRIAISFLLTAFLVISATGFGAYASSKTKESTVKENTLNYTVGQQNGTYFIFLDGADETNKPIGGVTYGTINFILVRKDSYSSIGPFTDLKKLVDEVTEQCNYMLDKKRLSQEEVKLVIEIATKIQSGDNSEFTDSKKELVIGTTTAKDNTTTAKDKASSTSKGNTAKKTISNKVITEGKVYYIFCDGADETNKPIGGVTDGSIGFVLVRKDSYSSIGPFTDLKKLVNEVTEQCNYMLDKQVISQDEVNQIIELATKIQSK